jgi:hypothetical protein
MAKKRWRRFKKVKDCPAPWPEGNTQRLALLLTHLSIRWTLPLKETLKQKINKEILKS